MQINVLYKKNIYFSTIKSMQLLVRQFVLIFNIAIVLIMMVSTNESISQNVGVGINISGATANPKALLDIDVKGMSQKAGLLLPRMSTIERNAIASPIPESLLIYNTDTHCFEAYYNGVWISWACLGNCQTPSQPIAGTNIPSANQIIWNWNTVAGAEGYQWNTSSIYPGVGVNVLSNPTYTQTGLTCNTSDTLYVWAYNNCGYSAYTLLVDTTTCCPVACGGSGIIKTVVGNGTYGYSANGVNAIGPTIYNPNGIAFDAAGNMYISDQGNQRICRVNSCGIIYTIAGTRAYGYNGDGIAATNAELYNPSSVAVDADGNVYIADSWNNRIRMVNTAGIISTIAGTGIGGYNGDGILATNAQIHFPSGLVIDGKGDLYFADYDNNRIRKVSGGIITNIAGNGTRGYTGDSGPATSAELYLPTGVAVDGSGNVYIADFENSVIRKVNYSTGIITTIAGNHIVGYSGDGGAATNAELSNAMGVAVDFSGTNVYIGDNYNNVVRKVSGGIITTFAGFYPGSSGYSGDGGLSTNAKLNQPYGVAVDDSGNVFIADDANNVIREVCH